MRVVSRWWKVYTIHHSKFQKPTDPVTNTSSTTRRISTSLVDTSSIACPSWVQLLRNTQRLFDPTIHRHILVTSLRLIDLPSSNLRGQHSYLKAFFTSSRLVVHTQRSCLQCLSTPPYPQRTQSHRPRSESPPPHSTMSPSHQLHKNPKNLSTQYSTPAGASTPPLQVSASSA
jgi:hypothetical protein